jgi:uncharacterized protein (DUF2235 family)
VPKNIVVCCDGTTNQIAGDMTNVLRIYRCSARNEDQLTFYDSGVGTIANPDRLTARGRTLDLLVDSALGRTVRSHVIDAYLFLVHYYEPGDRIFLFGFSRGAYTARAVAGMICFLGLLRKELPNLAQLAWSLYSGDNASQQLKDRFQGGHRFRKSFSIAEDTRIHFLGCWDTVSSFGWMGDLRTLPNTANNSKLDHVRHAVAIDERRALFQANHFRPKPDDMPKSIKEVWFAGSHGDVGGGYPEDKGFISKVSLEWMIREASGEGLLIDPANLNHLLNNYDGKHPLADPLGPIHDSLTGFWNLAELLPLRSYSGIEGRKRWKAPHLWSRRPMEIFIPGRTKPVIHESVQTRIANCPDYRPSNLPKDFDVET